MQVKISHWGNSLGVRIPKALAEQAGFQDGDALEIAATSEGLTLCKRTPQRKYSLEDLVSQITDENRHDEIDWGTPQGREVW